MITRFYERVDHWFQAHSKAERNILLGMGIFSLVLLWYLFLQNPLDTNKKTLSDQAESSAKQVRSLKKTISSMVLEAKKNEKQQELISGSKKKSQDKVELNLNSSRDTTSLLNLIYSEHPQMEFLTRKTVSGTPYATGNAPAGKLSFQLAFLSNYFTTMNYLDEMERLPWCFYWDNLTYKVSTYPEANVTINLHIVST